MSKETAQSGDGLQPDLQDSHENGVNAPVGPGQFPLGNTKSLTTGTRSLRSGPELFPERAALLLERERAIVADLGGEAEVSTAKREIVTRLVQASAIADSLAEDFIAHGVLTGKGRARRSVATWLSVIDRVHRLSQAVGLERKQKTVDLAQALAGQQQ